MKSKVAKTVTKESSIARFASRIHSVREISVNYEGHDETFAIRPPDVSAQGMFINTSRTFPEGAVLSLQFRLELSGAEVCTRSEVRYCLPGVGVGVEFVGISPAAIRIIEREIKLSRRKSVPIVSARKN